MYRMVSLNNIKKLVNTIPFYNVIVSRNIVFYEMFPETSFYQSFIWGHDTRLTCLGSNADMDTISILTKMGYKNNWLYLSN